MSRTYRNALLFGFITFAFGVSSARTEKMRKVFSGISNGYTILLQQPASRPASGPEKEPGDYSAISLSNDKKRLFLLSGLSGEALGSTTRFPTGSKSLGKYLMQFSAGPKGAPEELFIAFSNWLGGSDANEFGVILLSNKSAPKLVFRKSIHVTEVKDYDNDGLVDLLVSGGRGEPHGGGQSYDPYLVYKQVRSANSVGFEINEDLSKKWSTERGFSWHGPKYDESQVVDKAGK